MRASLVLSSAVLAAFCVGCGGESPTSPDSDPEPTVESPAARGNPRVFDQRAKSIARNATVEVESCFADTGDYANCRTPALTLGASITFVRGRPRPGEVAVSKATRTGYRILAPSESGTGSPSPGRRTG